MTLKEALEATIELLSDITIKISEADRIGVPVSHAISNLQACIAALDRKPEEPEEAPEEEEKPEE